MDAEQAKFMKNQLELNDRVLESIEKLAEITRILQGKIEPLETRVFGGSNVPRGSGAKQNNPGE